MKIIALLLFVASAAYGEIYTWKDARGTAFYTNSLHEIPARYRSKAKVLDVATGKKSPLATAQPGGQTGPPAAQAQQAPMQMTPAQQPSVPVTPAQQTPVQQTPAPTSPAVAAPALPPAPSAASATAARRQASRAQRRASRRDRGEE